jgi:hypothetical protein
MVQDDEDRHDSAQAVDVEITLGYTHSTQVEGRKFAISQVSRVRNGISRNWLI